MPLFYFNLINDISVTDDEGLDLPDISAARREAFQSAAELISEKVRSGGKVNLGHRIIVQDASRRDVFQLRYADLIEPNS